MKIFPQRFVRTGLGCFDPRRNRRGGDGVQDLMVEGQGSFEVIEADRDRQNVLLAQSRKQSGLDERRFTQARDAVKQRQRVASDQPKQILDLVTSSGKKTAVVFGKGSETDPGMLRIGPLGPGIVHWAAALRRRSRTISVSVLMNSGFASPPVARV